MAAPWCSPDTASSEILGARSLLCWRKVTEEAETCAHLPSLNDQQFSWRNIFFLFLPFLILSQEYQQMRKQESSKMKMETSQLGPPGCLTCFPMGLQDVAWRSRPQGTICRFCSATCISWWGSFPTICLPGGGRCHMGASCFALSRELAMLIWLTNNETSFINAMGSSKESSWCCWEGCCSPESGHLWSWTLLWVMLCLVSKAACSNRSSSAQRPWLMCLTLGMNCSQPWDQTPPRQEFMLPIMLLREEWLQTLSHEATMTELKSCTVCKYICTNLRKHVHRTYLCIDTFSVFSVLGSWVCLFQCSLSRKKGCIQTSVWAKKRSSSKPN